MKTRSNAWLGSSLVALGALLACACAGNAGDPAAQGTTAAPESQLVTSGVCRPNLPFPKAGAEPQEIALGDFNADGLVDMAVANFAGPHVTILLGSGGGHFKPTAAGAGSGNGATIAAGDFDGDGVLDLVVGYTNLAFMHGNGDGSFGAEVQIATSEGVSGVVAADLDGNGALDLVFHDGQTSGGIFVQLGRGDGTFGTPSHYAADAWASRASIGDLNHDGHVDIVVPARGNPSPGGLDVYMGRGGGAFAAMSRQEGPTDFGEGVLADFDGDGNLDFVGGGGSGVLFAKGKGDGTFGATVTNGSYGGIVRAADLDHDGKLDLVVESPADRTGGVGVMKGNGDGSFGAATVYVAGGYPVDVRVADLDGDGQADVATASNEGDFVALLEGKGDGTFYAPPTYASGAGAQGVVAVDLDGDGRRDLAIADATAGTVSVLLASGGGAFQPAVHYATGAGATHLAAGDLDGDGVLDLVTTGSSTVDVLLGAGGGAFGAPSSTAASLYPSWVGMADMNGDGKLDVVVAEEGSARRGGSEVVVMLGAGNGGFSSAVTSSLFGVALVSAALGDFDGDGRVDLATTADSSSTRPVGVMLGKGDGTLAAPALAPAMTGKPVSLAAADLDGDGVLDLVAGVANHLSVLWGKGGASFASEHVIPVAHSRSGVYLVGLAVADLDGNGVLDVALGGGKADSVEVVHGLGSRTFSAPQTLGAGLTDLALAAADFDGDGKADLAAPGQDDGRVTILYGACLP